MEILRIFAVDSLSNKIIDILNLTRLKNMDKVILYLKIWDIMNQYCWNYGPPKLLLRFTEPSTCNLNKRKTKMAVMFKIDNSESYSKTQTLVKIWSSLAFWT